MNDDTDQRKRQLQRIAEIRHQLSNLESVGTFAGVAGMAAGSVSATALGTTLLGATVGSFLGPIGIAAGVGVASYALKKRLELKRELESELAHLEKLASPNAD
jgi:lipid-binding SYLF domain-containing protein